MMSVDQAKVDDPDLADAYCQLKEDYRVIANAPHADQDEVRAAWQGLEAVTRELEKLPGLKGFLPRLMCLRRKRRRNLPVAPFYISRPRLMASMAFWLARTGR
jgi:hypothetical protein